MRLKKIIKMFEDGNVCVVGLRGRGKDMLFANVAVRRGLPYISNTDYKAKGKRGSKAKYLPLELEKLDCGKNTYKEFISGNVKKYVYPYEDKIDVYIADCGVFFPSQYCNELNKLYPYLPTYFALSRQLGKANVHTNCQQLSRIWLQLREQSDKYILCRRCIVLFGFVLQFVTIYQLYESCEKAVPAFKMKLPLFAKKEMKNLLEIERMKYTLQYGEIKKGLLFYRNNSDYNTRIFKEILENGN